MSEIKKTANMEVLSVRDYRNNLAASFVKAEKGEQVLIRRKKKIFALVNVGDEDLMISPELRQRIEEARKDLAEGRTRHFSNASDMQKWMDEL